MSTTYWFIGDFCLDIYRVSAVYSREFSLIGILKKFIKWFDLLLFGKVGKGTSNWFLGDFCLDIYRVPTVYSREFSIISILKKFINGVDLLLFGKAQHIGLSAIFVWIFIEFRQSVLGSLVSSAF